MKRPRSPRSSSSSERPRYIGYADGACRHNPGPGACGFLIKKLGSKDKLIVEGGVYLGSSTTNNVAEYKGVLELVAECEDLGIRSITVFVDSKLVANQYARKWKCTKPHLRKLLEQLWAATGWDGVSLAIRHVPRASNAAADALANEALDRRSDFRRHAKSSEERSDPRSMSPDRARRSQSPSPSSVSPRSDARSSSRTMSEDRTDVVVGPNPLNFVRHPALPAVDNSDWSSYEWSAPRVCAKRNKMVVTVWQIAMSIPGMQAMPFSTTWIQFFDIDKPSERVASICFDRVNPSAEVKLYLHLMMQHEKWKHVRVECNNQAILEDLRQFVTAAKGTDLHCCSLNYKEYEGLLDIEARNKTLKYLPWMLPTFMKK